MILYEKNEYHTKGYRSRIYLILPELKKYKLLNFKKNKETTYIASFPTKVLFTSDGHCAKIEYSVLGFGIGFELATQEL